jgi:hypothetical protein
MPNPWQFAGTHRAFFRPNQTSATRRVGPKDPMQFPIDPQQNSVRNKVPLLCPKHLHTALRAPLCEHPVEVTQAESLATSRVQPIRQQLGQDRSGLQTQPCVRESGEYLRALDSALLLSKRRIHKVVTALCTGTSAAQSWFSFSKVCISVDRQVA